MSAFSHLSLIAVGIRPTPLQVRAVHDAVVRSGVITGLVQPNLDALQHYYNRNSLWRRIQRALQPPRAVRWATEPGADYLQDGVPQTKGFTALGPLHPAITQIFDQPEARAVNERFFLPDRVSLSNQILLESEDASWEARGLAVSLNGFGYLFPWTIHEIRAAIAATPMLMALQHGLDACLPAPAWRPPWASRDLIATWSTWQPRTEGWVWAVSQSM